MCLLDRPGEARGWIRAGRIQSLSPHQSGGQNLKMWDVGAPDHKILISSSSLLGLVYIIDLPSNHPSSETHAGLKVKGRQRGQRDPIAF